MGYNYVLHSELPYIASHPGIKYSGLSGHCMIQHQSSSHWTVLFTGHHLVQCQTHKVKKATSQSVHASQIFNTLNGVFNLYDHPFITDSMEISYESPTM